MKIKERRGIKPCQRGPENLPRAFFNPPLLDIKGNKVL